MRLLALAAGSLLLLGGVAGLPSPRPVVIGARQPVFLGSMVVVATPLPATVGQRSGR